MRGGGDVWALPGAGDGGRAVAGHAEDERQRISQSRLDEGYRLACEARVLGDCKINVPPSSLTTAQRTQMEGRELDVPLDPVVRSYEVQLAPATREDLRSDATRL